MALDDLNSVISSILGDPQKMEQLRNVAQSLGMNPGGSPPGQGFGSNGAPPNMNNMNMNMNPNMGQQGNNGNGNPPSNYNNENNGPAANFMNNPAPPPNMNQPVNNGPAMNQPQNNGNPLGGLGGLNRALQAHISASRAGRIDDAVRIMQLMSAWPAIRDSGLLGSLGNLFSGGGHR